MSPFLKAVLIWAGVILLISYLLNVDIAGLIQGIIHAAQQIHNQHAGH